VSSPAERIVLMIMVRNICIRRTSRLVGDLRLESDVSKDQQHEGTSRVRNGKDALQSDGKVRCTIV
jgi:hypothetical protein